ncbi:MAG: HU family DNA-binding protein [Acidobacteria bacterium]|nr:HU family DNA-binding protein [Acidobacteriota bacterium]
MIDQIAYSDEISKQEFDKIVNSVPAAITKALQDRERIEVRGFGSTEIVRTSEPSRSHRRCR